MKISHRKLIMKISHRKKISHQNVIKTVNETYLTALLFAQEVYF